MTISPNAPALPITLTLGYRNPGHLLFSYFTHLSKGRLWVRSADPLAVGTSVKLELVIPGQSWTELLHAQVDYNSQTPEHRGPQGMNLALQDAEPMLGKLVDRLVPLTQPCRVDLVGANAFSTRHLAAITQTFMECRIEHRELRQDVALRCSGADLVVVDLEIEPTLGLRLVETLSDSPNAPALVVLCQDLSAPTAQAAARLAPLAQLPVERDGFRQAMLHSLGHTCWLGKHRVASLHDPVVPSFRTPAVSSSQALRLRTQQEQPSPVTELRPSAETDWSVDTSWSAPPDTPLPPPKPSTSADDPVLKRASDTTECTGLEDTLEPPGKPTRDANLQESPGKAA